MISQEKEEKLLNKEKQDTKAFKKHGQNAGQVVLKHALNCAPFTCEWDLNHVFPPGTLVTSFILVEIEAL